MKVCIVGAGAIGGFIGGMLAKAGVDVSFIARGEHLKAMQADGLRLQVDAQEFVIRAPFTSDPTELGSQDYIFLTLKAHSVPAIAESLPPLLGPDTAVVTAMNGLPYWYFYRHGGEYEGIRLNTVDPGVLQWDIFGPERGIGCVPYPAADVIAPGVVRHVHGKKFPIGEPSGLTTGRLEKLHEAMTNAGFDAPMRSDIRNEIWLKLWGNLCLNPISVLTHATVDMIVADAATRDLARHMMQEAEKVASHLGVHFRVGIERRLDGASAIIGHKMSTLQDLERGRPLEMDALLGVVEELGRMVGEPTPLAEALLALVNLKERVRLSWTS